MGLRLYHCNKFSQISTYLKSSAHSLEKEFILATDASGTVTTEVLTQIGDDGKEHSVEKL